MAKDNGLNLVLLLLLFGMYFIMSYISTKNIPELVYGIILIIYHVKFRVLQKKSL